ncbi:MAG: box helicase protein [Peptococcaceae bacterium]|jgi:superfamily II DNA/RNA helicase|nr:box helicase protein [Peptococcaceae bacterium]
MMSPYHDFLDLGIAQWLNEKLEAIGIKEPTEVQRSAIPAILAGKNVIVQSPTGTGKTLAYLAPLLTKINTQTKDLEVLILVPSRELAMQVFRQLKEVADNIGAVPLIGGANPARQLEALKEKPKLAVGTPGRIAELLQKRKINGQAVRAIVVDEVDKMLEQGFMEDVKKVFKATLKTRQVLFFSATVPREVLENAGSFMNEPQFIQTREKSRTPATIKHVYFTCDGRNKTQTLLKLYHIYRPKKALVFINHNEGVGPLTGRLQDLGLNAVGLHSDLAQPHRKEVLEKFRQGKADLLVTTDLLARGMDIPGVDIIFNFDLPVDEEHYLHRVGRTGRAGKKGTAISFVTEEQKFIMAKYQKLLQTSIEHMGLAENRVFPIDYSKKKEKKHRQLYRKKDG